MIPRSSLGAFLLVAVLVQGSGAWARLQTFGRVSMFEEGLQQAEKAILRGTVPPIPDQTARPANLDTVPVNPANTASPATPGSPETAPSTPSQQQNQNQEAGSVPVPSSPAPEAKKEEPKLEEPKLEAAKKEESKKEEPKSEEPKKEEANKEEPKNEEPKKEEPKNEEPKKWPVPLPEEAVAGHEGDLDRVLEYRRIMEPIAINSTVIVIPANLGFMDLAMNLYCRLQQLKATNVLIWALDGESSQKLKERGVAHIYDETLFSVSTAVGYGTSQENYSRMMSERPKVWWRILATGFNMLFLDADVVALDLPEKALEGSADFEGQLDYQARLGWGFSGMSNASTICAGVFFVRSSPKSLLWMDLVTLSFKSTEDSKRQMEKQYGHWDDQIALNYLLHDPKQSSILNPGLDRQPRRGWEEASQKQMSVLYAQPTRLLGGDMLERIRVTGTGYTASFSCQCQEQPGEFRPAVIHFNGRGKGAKVQAMKDNGWWELDDSGSCKGGSPAAAEASA